MKHFFKKLWGLFVLGCIIWILGNIFFLAATDQWAKLAKFAFFLAFGGIISHLEIIEFIIWRLKKIIKYNDFD